MTRKSTFKFALALMASVSAGTLALATPASAQESETTTLNRYFGSGYSYCDAKMMGALYGQDAYRGKLIIGTKIANGIGSNIPLMLNESRNQGHGCNWGDTQLSYNDAEKLGKHWGVSTSQAKTKAAAFYTTGYSRRVDEALAVSDTSQQQEQLALDAFFQSGFGYCDAKMIGAYLSQSAYEGKIFIGQKIKFGLIDNVPWYLNQAREGGNKCQWGEVPYDYDDAVKLAGLWNKDVAATKTTIANMVTLGRSDVVNASLGR